MEVHHHAHHGQHGDQKKKWNEYLLEFFMLFVAVTMGFFAENIREHTVTQHKLKENYESLIEDLKQDSAKIQAIYDVTGKNERNLVELKYLLFKYHKHQIDWPTLKKAYADLGGLPTYLTLFINNTTFKNMQSSGLLSYIENRQLKSQLSYYYEVVFKRLEDNNKLFDQAGVAFFNKEVPRRKSSEVATSSDSLLNNYPAEFADKKQYTDFMLNLESSKEILTSERLIREVDNYAGRFYDYHKGLKEIMKKNKELTAIIQSTKD